MISIKNNTGSSRSAGKFRLPHRVTMSIKHENEILTDYPIALNGIKRLSGIRSLKVTYSAYGRIISKFTGPTKSGGSCYEKALLLLAALLNG